MTKREQERFKKLQAVRRIGAPAWIIKYEQLQLACLRKELDEETYNSLAEKYVMPRMDGVGYIFIPDNPFGS